MTPEWINARHELPPLAGDSQNSKLVQVAIVVEENATLLESKKYEYTTVYLTTVAYMTSRHSNADPTKEYTFEWWAVNGSCTILKRVAFWAPLQIPPAPLTLIGLEERNAYYLSGGPLKVAPMQQKS